MKKIETHYGTFSGKQRSVRRGMQIADLFLQGNSTPSLRKTLHFYNNMSGDGGGEHVARLVKRCSDRKIFV